MPTDIGTDDAQRLLRQEGAYLLEVLPRDEYEEEHIAGAESIPLKELTADAVRHMDRDRPVIVYCDDDLWDLSPRAAWRLESLGFTRVFDLAGGKSEWREQGLPMEGNGPFRYVAGQVLKPVTFTCSPEASAGDIRERLRSDPFCVVVNEHDVVLGRVRAKDLPSDDDVLVADFMRLGPSTVQRREELSGLVDRMHEKGVKTILVTTPKGELLGYLDRDDADRLLATARGTATD